MTVLWSYVIMVHFAYYCISTKYRGVSIFLSTLSQLWVGGIWLYTLMVSLSGDVTITLRQELNLCT